jgi:hypothetical protein
MSKTGKLVIGKAMQIGIDDKVEEGVHGYPLLVYILELLLMCFSILFFPKKKSANNDHYA